MRVDRLLKAIAVQLAYQRYRKRTQDRYRIRSGTEHVVRIANSIIGTKHWLPKYDAIE